MCLAIPGKILEITHEDPLSRSGKVDFAGVTKEINLAFVPDAKIDDYVIVHVGVAISVLDEEEALLTLDALDELGQMHLLAESEETP